MGSQGKARVHLIRLYRIALQWADLPLLSPRALSELLVLQRRRLEPRCCYNWMGALCPQPLAV